MYFILHNAEVYYSKFGVGDPTCMNSGPTEQGLEEGSGSVKGGTPLASMAISMKDLQSVQLRKTETAPTSSKSRFGNNVSKTMSAPSSGKSITYQFIFNENMY